MAKKSTNHSNPYKDLVIGLIALLASYGFASWAIDSGSIWHYIFAFVSLYYAVHFIKLAIKNKYFNNDKKRKTSRARS